MLPLSDGMRARRFPVVTVALIAANLAVWILYELPDVAAARTRATRRSRGRSAGSRRCSSMRTGATSSATCSGVAFAAHVGGFLLGMLAAYALASAGRIRTQETPRSALSPF